MPGYHGFGGIGPELSKNDDMTKEEVEAHAKIQDYTAKVPSFYKAKGKNDSK